MNAPANAPDTPREAATVLAAEHPATALAFAIVYLGDQIAEGSNAIQGALDSIELDFDVTEIAVEIGGLANAVENIAGEMGS